jgi:hypothetical protein
MMPQVVVVEWAMEAPGRVQVAELQLRAQRVVG